MSKDNEAGFSLPDGGEELTAALAAIGDSAELSKLHAELVKQFDALYANGEGVTAENFPQLETLKGQILAVKERDAALSAERDDLSASAKKKILETNPQRLYKL